MSLSEHKFGSMPHLLDLISRMRQSEEDTSEIQRSLEFILEQLPYSLNAAANAVIVLANAQISVKSKLPNMFAEKGGNSLQTCILPEHLRNEMGYAVDNYFDAARRTQNALNYYLSKVLKKSLPHSLNDLVKKIDKDKSNVILPDRISKFILGYWKADGQRVKLYRDLAQHHAVISSDARLIITPGDKQFIYLVLPNNPHVTKIPELKYGDPRVDAFPYVYNSFINLYKYVFGITHILLSYTETPSHHIMSQIFKQPLIMSPRIIIGHPMPSISKINETFENLTGSLYAKYNSELPRKDIVPTLTIFKK